MRLFLWFSNTMFMYLLFKWSYLVGSSWLLKELWISKTLELSSLSMYEYEMVSWSTGRFLWGSICEWNSLTTVIGTFKRDSITYPMVTSSGNRIFSPTDSNLPPPMSGIIFEAKDCERQKPAPPVANQNFTCNNLMACQCAHAFQVVQKCDDYLLIIVSVENLQRLWQRGFA